MLIANMKIAPAQTFECRHSLGVVAVIDKNDLVVCTLKALTDPVGQECDVLSLVSRWNNDT